MAALLAKLDYYRIVCLYVSLLCWTGDLRQVAGNGCMSNPGGSVVTLLELSLYSSVEDYRLMMLNLCSRVYAVRTWCICCGCCICRCWLSASTTTCSNIAPPGKNIFVMYFYYYYKLTSLSRELLFARFKRFGSKECSKKPVLSWKGGGHIMVKG